MNLSANIADRLAEQAATSPERPALVWERRGLGGRLEALTYAALQARVERLAAGFQAEGLRPGDRAIVFVPMTPDLYLVLLALWRAGGVAIFFDPWFSAENARRVCETMRPSWWIAAPMAFGLLLRCRTLRSIPRRVATCRFPFGPRLHIAVLERRGAAAPAVVRAPEDMALVTFTGGTMGAPKGANRTHGFLRAQHAALERVLGARADDVELSHFPIFALNALAAGRTAVLPRLDFGRPGGADARRMHALIESARVTAVTGSPAFFDAVAGGMRRAGRIAPRVRAIFTGGGPVGGLTLERIAAAFPNAVVNVVYGSTESEPIAHIAAVELDAAAVAETARGGGRCVGTPVPEIRVRLMAEDREAVGAGEVWVAGAHVCGEYVGDPESNGRWKRRDAEGVIWHRTGDLARWDDRGRLWLLGRVGETAPAVGGSVAFGAVEAAAETVDGVERAAVAPIARSNGAVFWRLGWTCAPETARSAAAVEADLRALFATRGWPVDRIRRLRRLPTDPRHNTKIDRARLARRLGKA